MFSSEHAHHTHHPHRGDAHESDEHKDPHVIGSLSLPTPQPLPLPRQQGHPLLHPPPSRDIRDDVSILSSASTAMSAAAVPSSPAVRKNEIFATVLKQYSSGGTMAGRADAAEGGGHWSAVTTGSHGGLASSPVPTAPSTSSSSRPQNDAVSRQSSHRQLVMPQAPHGSFISEGSDFDGCSPRPSTPPSQSYHTQMLHSTNNNSHANSTANSRQLSRMGSSEFEIPGVPPRTTGGQPPPHKGDRGEIGEKGDKNDKADQEDIQALRALLSGALAADDGKK